MGIPRIDFFDFIFNFIDGVGRGIKKNQIDWQVADTEFVTAVQAIPLSTSGKGNPVYTAGVVTYDASVPLLTLSPSDAGFTPVWGDIVLFIAPDIDDNRSQLQVRFGTGLTSAALQDRDGTPTAAIQLVSGRIYIGYLTRNPPGGSGTAIRISEFLEQPSPVPTVITSYWFLIDDDTTTPTETQILAGNAITTLMFEVAVPNDGTYTDNDAWLWFFTPYDDISILNLAGAGSYNAFGSYVPRVGPVSVGGVDYYGYRNAHQTFTRGNTLGFSFRR